MGRKTGSWARWMSYVLEFWEENIKEDLW